MQAISEAKDMLLKAVEGIKLLKKPYHAALIKEKGEFKIVPISGYKNTCPDNTKALSAFKKAHRGVRVIALIHTHPKDKEIMSTVDVKKAPSKTIHIIVGKKNWTIWFKHNKLTIWELKLA